MSHTNGLDNSPENGENGNNGNTVNSWALWQRLVLSELKQNKQDNADNAKEIGELKIAMAVMQTKAAITGAIIGFLTSAVTSTVLYFLIEKMMKG